MTAALLWQVPVAYLLLGCVCAALVNWTVEEGCPWLVIAWTVAGCVLVTPYVCARHQIGPWRLDMVLEGTK